MPFKARAELLFVLPVNGMGIQCKNVKLAGTFNSTTLARVKIDVEGCGSLGFKCNSASPLKDTAGVILEEVDAKPVWITKAGELAGLLFKPVAGSETVVTFECTVLLKLVVKGELLCDLSPENNDTKNFVVQCAVTAAGSGKSKYSEYSAQLEPLVATIVKPLLIEVNGSKNFEEFALLNEETLETELLSEIMT
jgi:hypothetical protein